jgi:hypothetical protein
MNDPKMDKTVRELGGEIWAEITHRQNDQENDSLIGKTDFRATQELIDLVMGILARHIGCEITDDENLPVEPLKVNKDS